MTSTRDPDCLLQEPENQSSSQQHCYRRALRDREAMGGLCVGPLCRRGVGQGPVHDWDAERSAADHPSGGLVSPLRRPPTMKRAGAEPVQELVAELPPHCWGPGIINGNSS